MGARPRLTTRGWTTSFQNYNRGLIESSVDGPDLTGMVRAPGAVRRFFLLDLGLPGGDGYKVMERVRSLSHLGPTPIVEPVDNQVLLGVIREALV